MDEWIADLRRRQHDQRLALNRLEDAHNALDKDVATMRTQVHSMATAQEVGEEVERRLQRREERDRARIMTGLTAGQKLVAIVLALEQVVVGVLVLRGH